MPSNENNNNILPTENVITDVKFGNNVYEIGLGSGTREAIEGVFEDINDNFELLNTTIEENEETVSSSLNDLETRKADKTDIPTVPTNVSAFTNDAGYLTQHQSLSDYATKNWVEAKNYLTSHQDISAYFNDVEYDSNSKRINFKNGNTVKKYIDATDFIKDGMVDSVTIGDVTIDSVLTKCLIITFNTDSGKENINIPLTNIFDPDEYYTKDDIDDSEKAIAAALTDLQSSKLDASVISDYYTKTEVDNKGYYNGASSDLTNQNIELKYDDTTLDTINLTQMLLKYGIEFVVGTQSAATNAWTGVTNSTALFNGKTIAYYLPYAGTSTAATLNLTLADGQTTTGAIGIQYTGTTNASNQYGAGSVIVLTYVSSANKWKRCDYNTNTTYSVMSLADLQAGTATTGRTLSAKLLKQAYYISGQTITIASDSLTVPKLYSTTGDATDGAMTQGAVTEALQEFNCGEY